MAHHEKKLVTSSNKRMMQSSLLALVPLVLASTLSGCTTLYFVPPQNQEYVSCKVLEEDYEPVMVKIMQHCLMSQITYPGNLKRTTHWNTSLNV